MNLMLLMPAVVDNPSWEEGKTHYRVSWRHVYLAKVRGQSFKDEADICVQRVELRYRDNFSLVLTDRYWRKFRSQELDQRGRGAPRRGGHHLPRGRGDNGRGVEDQGERPPRHSGRGGRRRVRGVAS